MKPQSKKIIYLIFKPFPSEIVRARIFQGNFSEAGCSVRYFRVFSPGVDACVTFLERFRLLRSLGEIISNIQVPIRRVKEVYLLRIVAGYDGVIILKYCTPAFLQSIKKHSHAKILYDFDDAVWLPSILGEDAFEKLVALSDFVSCDNEYLGDHARRYHSRVFILNGPSQVELFDAYDRANPRGLSQKITIGWIGSWSTLFYLYAVFDALEVIGRMFKNIELVLVGTGHNPAVVPLFENLPVRQVASYDQEAMIRFASGFDIGIYPLFDNDLSRGRGSLKATIYMSAGVPTVASRLGENVRLITHGKTGFLASTKEEWVGALSQLIQDADLRTVIGFNARALMREQFSIAACFRQLEENFLSQI